MIRSGPVFLTFEGDREAGEPFAYMVPNVAMNRALRRKATELGISVTDGMAATAIQPEPASMDVTLANGDQVSRQTAGRRRWREIQTARHGGHQSGAF